MRRRRSVYGVVSLSLLLYLVTVSHTAGQPIDPNNPDRTIFSYQEECNNEGCSNEEVRELYSSYAEECLNEGCSKEEVFELGGLGTGVSDMQQAFVARGFRINPADFNGANPFCAGTTTTCYGFLLVCDDHCTYPDGSTSGSYVCGGCIFGVWGMVSNAGCQPLRLLNGVTSKVNVGTMAKD
jgi:hypothetical protein